MSSSFSSVAAARLFKYSVYEEVVAKKKQELVEGENIVSVICN
jgi:hypothetical protein